jgi:hypothetical protein
MVAATYTNCADIVQADYDGPESILKLAQKLGLVSKDNDGPKCPHCEHPMTLHEDEEKVDGYVWRCKRTAIIENRKRKCNSSRSIRSEWLASRSHLSLRNVMLFARYWVQGLSHNVIKAECRISSTNASSKMTKKFVELLRVRFIDQMEPIGGKGKTVSCKSYM